MSVRLLHGGWRLRTAVLFVAMVAVQVLLVLQLLTVNPRDAMSVVMPIAIAAPFIFLGLLYSPSAAALIVPFLLVIPAWIFGFTISEGVLLAALLLGWLRFVVSGRRAEPLRVVEIVFVLYVAWAALSVYQAVEVRGALKAWKSILMFFLAFMAGLRLLGGGRVRSLVCVVSLLGSVITIQLAAILVQSGHSPAVLLSRVSSLTDLGWGYSNYVAAVAALTTAASVPLYLYGRPWERMVGVAGLFSAVFVSIATVSRGGTLALAVGLAVAALLEARRKFFMAGGFIVVVASAYLLSPLGQAGLGRFVRPQDLPSVAARLIFYQEGFQVAQAHPFFGVGPDQLPYNTHVYIGANPHNFLLKNAIDLGLPGLVLYLLVLGMLAARIRRLRKVPTPEARMLALCLTLLLSIALTNALYEPTLEGWVYGCVFWMLTGALYAASEAPSGAEEPVT